MTQDTQRQHTASPDAARETTDAPEEFPEVTEDVHTDHKCPKCGYAWSGKAG